MIRRRENTKTRINIRKIIEQSNDALTHALEVAKQSEQESINRFGEFRTNYYFLYESGELEKVELEEYMSFREGDTLERYEIKDE
mgnify:CR=1 FL=1